MKGSFTLGSGFRTSDHYKLLTDEVEDQCEAIFGHLYQRIMAFRPERCYLAYGIIHQWLNGYVSLYPPAA